MLVGTSLSAFVAYCTEASTFFCSSFWVMKSAGIWAPSMWTSLYSPSTMLWVRVRQRRSAWLELETASDAAAASNAELSARAWRRPPCSEPSGAALVGFCWLLRAAASFCELL